MRPVQPHGTAPGTSHHNGDPILGSVPDADFFNVHNAELVHLVEHAGLEPSWDDRDLQQVRKAVDVMIAAAIGSIGQTQIPADIAFEAGWSHDGVGEDLRVQTYGSVKLGRAITIEGEVGDAGLAPTGAAVIMDIERDGISIYTVKPQIGAGGTGLTAGVLDATKVACPAGTVLTCKCVQTGSIIRGQQVRFTLKARS